MGQWLDENLSSWDVTWADVFLGLALFVVTFVTSLVVVGFVVVHLPADSFSHSAPRGAPQTRSVGQWALVIGKNVLGALLIVIGIILSMPGLPGQGALTVLIGTLLVDFPGKHRFLRWLLRHRQVLGSANRLRQRYGKPPLIVD